MAYTRPPAAAAVGRSPRGEIGDALPTVRRRIVAKRGGGGPAASVDPSGDVDLAVQYRGAELLDRLGQRRGGGPAAVPREEGEAKEKREKDGSYSTVHVPSRVSSVPRSASSRFPPKPAARAWAYTSASYDVAGAQYSTPSAMGNSGGSSPTRSCASVRLVSSCARISSRATPPFPTGTTSSASVPGFKRSPRSPCGPNTSGLPCSTCSCAWGAASFVVKPSNTPSLKTTQFWNTSTNEAPLCACARFSSATTSACCVSTARPTNRPPAPRANAHGETGFSIDPWGVEGEWVPRREVGEYCPFVRP